MEKSVYREYMQTLDKKKELSKLEEYERTLLSPDEVKKLVLAVCKGDIEEAQKILLERVLDYYEKGCVDKEVPNE